MGGRGASSGINSGGVLDRRAEERTIETAYREPNYRGSAYYKDEVLEAVPGGSGEVDFVYATPDNREKTAKTNRTQYVTFKLKSGSVNGESFGIKWENVKSVSGQTYNMRDQLKELGFKWDKTGKKWKR